MNDTELARLRVAEHPEQGVNLVGPLETGSGLGEAARMLARAVERTGVPFVAISRADSPSHGLEPREWPPVDVVPYDTNVLCLQPDQLGAFAGAVGTRFFAGRTTIALWFWESSALPEQYRPALGLLDRIWVPTEYVRTTVAATTTLPVRVVPLPLAERAVEPIPRNELGLPDGFVFLSLFDCVSANRKNPHAAIDAFRRAFEPGSGATLVLKTVNGHRKPRLLAELDAAVADRDDIVLIDAYVPARERDAMITACDCFVSLHRSEGLGLPLLEAMCLGKPVIATGYSGNVDFMDDESGYLVPFRLVPVPEGVWGHSAGAEWAEPSVEAAALLMRRAFDDPAAAAAVGALGRKKILARFSLERSAAALTAELEEARCRARPRERARRRGSLFDATLALARDPVRAGYPKGGPVAGVRRLLGRVLWPQLATHYERDAAMLDGLVEVERSLAALESRVDALQSTVVDPVDVTREEHGENVSHVGAKRSARDPAE